MGFHNRSDITTLLVCSVNNINFFCKKRTMIHCPHENNTTQLPHHLKNNIESVFIIISPIDYMQYISSKNQKKEKGNTLG